MNKNFMAIYQIINNIGDNGTIMKASGNFIVFSSQHFDLIYLNNVEMNIHKNKRIIEFNLQRSIDFG